MSKACGHRSTNWLKGAEGSSATEFALVLPLLLLLLVAFFEVGRLLWSYNVVSSSVRDASRYAARLSMTCAGFANGGDMAIVQRLARTGTVDAGGTPVLPDWTVDGSVQVTFGCVNNASSAYLGLYDGMTQIPTVTVFATAPYSAGMSRYLPGFTFTQIKARHSQVWTQQ